MNAIMTPQSAALLRPAGTPRATAHLSKRSKLLKLQLSTRLAAVRKRYGLDRDEVYDRPRFVTDWESADKPHAPNLLHLVAVAGDARSKPYALEALEWARQEIEREEPNPKQLSLFTPNR